MSEIVCVHRWTEKAPFARHSKDGTNSDGWWRHCLRCETTQYDNQPEPRVVIARVE